MAVKAVWALRMAELGLVGIPGGVNNRSCHGARYAWVHKCLFFIFFLFIISDIEGKQRLWVDSLVMCR